MHIVIRGTAAARVITGALLSACVALAPAAAVASETGNRKPNVVFLLSDDQRPDTIAALGNSIIRTPHLDRLVREGTAFTRAVSPNPLCVPSRAEILTGCSGFRNGILPGFRNTLDPDIPLWPETMRAAGYHTWYVGKWHTSGKPTTRGYEQSLGLFFGGMGNTPRGIGRKGREITGYHGWVFQSDDGQLFPDKGIGLTDNISAHFADAAIEFIQRKPDKPFFLHVNFTAPHDPLIMPPGYDNLYDPRCMPLPANFRPQHPFDHGNFSGRDEQLLPWPRTPDDVRDELAVYYAVISHMDAQIGRILAALDATGQRDNTIVIFSSDHGLALGSHGLMGKQNMYEHSIGVPLVLSGPSIPRGVQCDAQVYLRDLYPTACELAGITVPPAIEGKSFVPILTGRAQAIHPSVFGYFTDTQRMVRTDRWKLVHYPRIERYQLFDLCSDPCELLDLSNDPRWRDMRRDLMDRLHALQREAGDPLAAR